MHCGPSSQIFGSLRLPLLLLLHSVALARSRTSRKSNDLHVAPHVAYTDILLRLYVHYIDGSLSVHCCNSAISELPLLRCVFFSYDSRF